MLNGATARIDPRGSARRSPTAGNRGQGGKWLHPATRRRIYERDHWRCVWCGIFVAQIGMGFKGVSVEGIVFTDGMRLQQASIDHVVPRARGGSNKHTNLITCCARCNAKRNDRGVSRFAAVIVGGVLGERVRTETEQIVRRVRNAQRRKLPIMRTQ